MKVDLNEIERSGLTLRHVLTLIGVEYVRLGQEYPHFNANFKDYNELFDMGMLVTGEDEYRLTPKARDVFNIIVDRDITLTKNGFESMFNEFWATFPTSDMNGKWLRTRSLKSNKANCLKMYHKILKDGVEHKDIIKSLKWEISDKKASSTTTNRMTYMKNSSTWLFQREFDIIAENMTESTNEEPEKDWTNKSV